MSSGGSFVLITNDGKIDKLLLATSYLSQNLANITEMRRKKGLQDPTPTISDIEKSHLLFFYNSFSPYVSLAFDYSKVTPTGSATPGGNLTFSIPLAGDLITDAVFRVQMGEVVASRTDEFTEYLRYVEFLGERLFRRVELTINGNNIDNYEFDVMPTYRNFRLLDHKKYGWYKMNGQELKFDAYGDTLSGRGNLQEVVKVVHGLQTPKQVQPAHELYIPAMFWFCGDPRDSIPSVSIPFGQRLINVDIAETRFFLQYAGISSIYDDPAANPAPDPSIKVDMYINNIYINPDVHDTLIKQISFNLVRIYMRQNNDLHNASDRIQFTQVKFPIESIFFNIIPDINRDPREPGMLTDWWRSEKVDDVEYNECCMPNFMNLSNAPQPDVTVNTQIGQITRTMLLTPGNFVLLNGFDISAAMAQLVADNDQTFIALLPPNPGSFITSVRQFYEILEYVGFAGTLDWNATFNTVTGVADLTTTLGEMISETFCSKTYKECTPVVDHISLESHGVKIYQDHTIPFYNAYLPWRYGCLKIVTPKSCGNGVFFFSLFPGDSQPSGYFNFSRARETYFEYANSIITAQFPAKFVAICIAINFLLISDGTALLRFGT